MAGATSGRADRRPARHASTTEGQPPASLCHASGVRTRTGSLRRPVSFYITTPIYYVNAVPHLGHAYTTIAADIMARHMRQRGEDVFFLTGTDEHGEPVAQAAEREGVTPKELADRNAERFKALAPQLNASNDFFIRTSDEEHVAMVQEILTRVRDNGHVYKGFYEGWYCPRCADFKTESEIGPDNTCLIHFIALDREQEENYFFALSTFQSRLEALYAERPDFVMPRRRYNEAKAFIDQGLQDVSLTRAKLTWGVAVPWDPDHVFYVWFDALLNYYTALSYAHDGADETARFWPASFHIIGNDILKFHTIFWPALLMAADLEVPDHVFVHGMLLGGDGRKMSKSLGNVLDPFAVIDDYGTDALRFYCARDVPFGTDGPVSDAAVASRYDAELANDYGNLASRTLAMVHRYRDGKIPDVDVDPGLTPDFEGVCETVEQRIDVADISGALEQIWERVRRLNRYVEETAPWVLARDDAQAAQLDMTLRSLTEGLRTLTVLLHPYMPATTEKLLAALGNEDLSLPGARFGSAPGGATVQKLEPLFPKRQA
jgi:methionyl-tRNA synthetase